MAFYQTHNKDKLAHLTAQDCKHAERFSLPVCHTPNNAGIISIFVFAMRILKAIAYAEELIRLPWLYCNMAENEIFHGIALM